MELFIDGRKIQIDDSDVALLAADRQWRVGTVGKSKVERVFFVDYSGTSPRYVQLHRLIIPNARYIAFANGDTLDFRRANLIEQQAPTPALECPFSPERLAAMYEIMSTWEIAMIAGERLARKINSQTVHRWLRQSGITPRNRSGAQAARHRKTRSLGGCS